MENDNMTRSKKILNINVGILGHVDSGKTSLVKALSTQLSTAALDKNPQSQQRGITLDLGFSAFTLSIPDHLSTYDYDLLQFTLVDCPGHASLIRTIIGGAQIIDMMLLVIDANKGIQTQTAECIVIGEITTDNMIIVLNKIDLIPENEREQKLDKVIKRIKKVFSTTKFSNAPIVCTAASVGGEKVAAVSSTSISGLTSKSLSLSENIHSSSNDTTIDMIGLFSNTTSSGIKELVDLIRQCVIIPKRNYQTPFYYAIDHCFAIRGHGTVITGTVLSGTIKTNQIIEFPELQKQKKVKSMQMFKKNVKLAQQGDRVGICIADLDPKSIERGIASTPDSVPLLYNVICLIKKIRFFKFTCRSNSKFHVSIGHTTVIANVTFFGASELSSSSSSLSSAENMKQEGDIQDISTSDSNQLKDSNNEMETQVLPKVHTTLSTSIRPSVTSNPNEILSPSTPSSSSSFHKQFPSMPFMWDRDYIQQNELIGSDDLRYGHEPLQWALLEFQSPVYCPLNSLVIGSKLDLDTKESSSLNTAKITTSEGDKVNAAQQCRLAFYGPIYESLPETSIKNIKIYNWKYKEGKVFKITDCRLGLCYELIGDKMFSDATSLARCHGMKIITEKNKIGIITGPFGSDGKFKVKFDIGTRINIHSKLILKYKRYIYDKAKTMHQPMNSIDFFEHNLVPGYSPDEMELPDDPSKMKTNSSKLDRKAKTKTIKTNNNTIISEPISLLSSNINEKNISSNIDNSNSSIDSKNNVKDLNVLSVSTSSNQNDNSNTLLLPYQYSNSSSSDCISSTAMISQSSEEKSIDHHDKISITKSILSESLKDTDIRIGYIDSIKLEDIKSTSIGSVSIMTIIKDAFKIEENIKEYSTVINESGEDSINTKYNVQVIGPNNTQGILRGPFAKLGKCKIQFQLKNYDNINSNIPFNIGDKVEIMIQKKVLD